MSREQKQQPAPPHALTRRLGSTPQEGRGPRSAAPVALLVRARWVILLLLGVYVLYAATFYPFSRFGFFLSLHQGAFFLLSLGGVALYNLSYQDPSRGLSRFAYASHFQVLLDTWLVTVLVHFSGGAASWVWPLYLFVAIEAVYLLKRRGEVWGAWCASAILYGGLLALEHTGVIHAVRMPFVDPRLVDDSVYLMFLWFWVLILNAAVSEIGFHLMSVARSEAQQVKQNEEELYRMAHHDVLTGLPNRLLFMDRIQQMRAMCYRMGQRMGVLFLDLDRFKEINDTLGHDVGDKLLQEVAKRLGGSVRGMDTVARLGGDEFVIALANLRDVSGAETVARKVLEALSVPCLIDGHELKVTTSIGISIYPEDGYELDELLKKADLALYTAKGEGRSCFRRYLEGG